MPSLGCIQFRFQLPSILPHLICTLRGGPQVLLQDLAGALARAELAPEDARGIEERQLRRLLF